VTTASFLRAAVTARTGEKLRVVDFKKRLRQEFDALGIPWEFASRYINDGFSGGEKKRFEILQMLMLQPRLVILDEVDSGLDIDALKTVATGIRRAADGEAGVLIVTHYQRILEHLRPDFVHVFVDGRIVRSGGPEQARELERRGYEWLVRSPSPEASPEGATP
jgi:Fe-S cluster assembly ATP-binding protein